MTFQWHITDECDQRCRHCYIFADGLMEMWTHAKQTYRRYDKFEACGKCKLMPWCRGGPAVAAAETGSFFGRDPQCWRIVE